MADRYADMPAQNSKIVKNDLSWELTVDDIPREAESAFELPGDVQVYMLNENEAEERYDFLVRMPEGYVEPEHTHPAAHATICIDGTITLHGETLTPGDYFYGHQQPHGPIKYSCDHTDYGNLNFTSFVGGSPVHDYDEDPNE